MVNSAHPRFLSPPSPQRLVAEHRPALLLTDTWKGQTHTGPASRRPVRSLGAPRSLCPPVPEGQVRSWPCSGCLGHADGWQLPCKPGKGRGPLSAAPASASLPGDSNRLPVLGPLETSGRNLNRLM